MKSDINKTLNLYHRIDKAVESHYRTHKKQPPCKEGCASCCSQFFEVSEDEYATIDFLLHQLPIKEQSNLKIKAQVLLDIFQENWPDFYSDYFAATTSKLHNEAYYKRLERFQINIPCIFLSDEGRCEIYASRPIVCRTTGSGFLQLFNRGAICSVIHSSLFTPLWQADLRTFNIEIDKLRWIEEDSPMAIQRQYPLFYYVAKRFESNTM